MLKHERIISDGMLRIAVIFGAFAVGLAASVIIRRLLKKEIPLYGNTCIPLLGITLNDRDKKLLLLAGISFMVCIVILIVSFL